MPEDRWSDETEPIHLWFSLSYANYLVLNRSLLQSMPVEWQRSFVRLLEQLDEAFTDVKRAPSYWVRATDGGRFITDPVPHCNRGRTRIPRRDQLFVEDPSRV